MMRLRVQMLIPALTMIALRGGAQPLTMSKLGNQVASIVTDCRHVVTECLKHRLTSV
jgi:hypothetical protein